MDITCRLAGTWSPIMKLFYNNLTHQGFSDWSRYDLFHVIYIVRGPLTLLLDFSCTPYLTPKAVCFSPATYASSLIYYILNNNKLCRCREIQIVYCSFTTSNFVNVFLITLCFDHPVVSIIQACNYAIQVRSIYIPQYKISMLTHNWIRRELLIVTVEVSIQTPWHCNNLRH